MSMGTSISGNHVMLRSGPLRLLLPQAAVRAAEYRHGMPVPTGRFGVFELQGERATRLVIAPSSGLRPLAAYPIERFVITQLQGCEDDVPWLAWDEVRVLIDKQFERWPLPAAVAMPGLPVEGYVELGPDLAFTAQASALAAHVHGRPGGAS